MAAIVGVGVEYCIAVACPADYIVALIVFGLSDLGEHRSITYRTLGAEDVINAPRRV